MQADNSVTEARTELETAKRKLFQTYLSEISVKYNGLGREKKDFLLRGLDSLLQCLAVGNLVEKGMRGVLFDPEIARKVREEAGLSQQQLSKEIGCGFGAQSTISDYETSLKKPRDLNGKITRKYIDCLKEHGYNPFNL